MLVSLVTAVAHPTVLHASALAFFVNEPTRHDYGHQLVLPDGFGDGEFTFEMWIRPDASFPVGPTSGEGQLTNWSDADVEPYSSGDWWFEGNFLLDGHNNANFGDGTFSLQFYGGGRVRWLFGDGANAVAGGHWSVGAFPATDTPSLLDGSWHHVTLVRRWSGQSDAQLELWIDGSLVATETSFVRTDMRTWWDTWAGFPVDQEGWFWGAEKQAAIGVLSQYEDYKGPIDSVHLWSRAKTPIEVTSDWDQPVLGTEPGLVGWFRFDEGMGPQACDSLDGTRCIDLFDMKPGHWSLDCAPPDALFRDDFESGDTSAWPLIVP